MAPLAHQASPCAGSCLAVTAASVCSRTSLTPAPSPPPPSLALPGWSWEKGKSSRERLKRRVSRPPALLKTGWGHPQAPGWCCSPGLQLLPLRGGGGGCLTAAARSRQNAWGEPSGPPRAPLKPPGDPRPPWGPSPAPHTASAESEQRMRRQQRSWPEAAVLK